MSLPYIAPKFASSKLFCGKNTGSDLLIGRQKELADLDDAWCGTGKKNIVTIVAWGGIGKTSLVAHWAAKKLAQPDYGGTDRYFDWSFYSQGTRREGDTTGASHAASGDLFLKQALEFFGDPTLADSNAGAWQKGERLAQLIGQHRTLLILDGLEPLQDARTGELRDDGLRALLRGLAQHNAGLCLVTTREHLPELATWHQTTPEWKLEKLTDEAGAALLSKLGVKGTDKEMRELSTKVKGHALTLTLLGNYLRKAHYGDIRRVDRVDFQKVNEKEQSGHAFRVIAAYERWLDENDCRAELAILRILGLFDRPATPDCLATLRDPPIPGLTDALGSLDEEDWNEVVTHLVELGLVEEQPWEPRRVVGYSEQVAKAVNQGGELGEPKPFESRQLQIVNRNALDAHPLVREFFARRSQETSVAAWKAAHSRLFEHLQANAPYWPEGLDGLQPLYQSVAHGCQAGRHQEAYLKVYRDRILRGTSGHAAFFSWKKLGAFGANLGALTCFFEQPWRRLVPSLSPSASAWLLNETAVQLRAVGWLREAVEPTGASFEYYFRAEDWRTSAIIASNLSELKLTLGDIAGAISNAEQSVTFADRTDDWSLRMGSRATLADALHQEGRRAEALGRFREAASMSAENQPTYPSLYSFQGFRYWDLLLAEPERAAWQLSGCARYHQPVGSRCGEDIASYLTLSRQIERRGQKMFESRAPNDTLLDIALDHLTLGRAALYGTIVEDSPLVVRNSEFYSHLTAAVDGFRRAGQQDYVPLGLLSRAWSCFLKNDIKGTRADLDEAQQIAERGPMPLHLADIHLHRGRLFRDKEELKLARCLIEQCGYWRRKQELEDAEEAAENWPNQPDSPAPQGTTSVTHMKIPNSVIFVVGDVLGSSYLSHTKLNTLFGGCGFPGDPPQGNRVTKCQEWLKRANNDPAIDPLDLLGKVLVEFTSLQLDENGVERIKKSLADSGLTLQPEGKIVPQQARKRFRVALSFPGEHRPFVEQIAECLSSHVGRDRVLYDKYYEAEFARPNLDTYLQRLYHDESEMIAIFLCADYDRKEWCGLEWRALRDVLKRRRDDDLMPFRFDDTTISGIFSIDGYVWIGSRTPQEVADLILHRLQVNDSQSNATLAPADPSVSRMPNTIGVVTTAGANKSAQTATDSYNRGLRCLSEQNYEGALDALSRAIQLDSTVALAHYNRGLTHYFRHDEDLAIEGFNRALELGFVDALLFRNRGNAFSRKGDVARALADYAQAIALEPENPIAYLNRGEVYENTLRKNLASADYNIVLSLVCEPQFKETARKRLLAMGVRTSASQSPPALVIWQRKLTFLQAEEAKVADADQKFSIQQRIEEARAKIQELGG